MKQMTVHEYLEYHIVNNIGRKCNFLILPNGNIILAEVGETSKTLRKYYCEQRDITEDQFERFYEPTGIVNDKFICDKYNLVCAWFNVLMCPRVLKTNHQKNTIDILCEHGVLLNRKYIKYIDCNEYYMYKRRRKAKGCRYTL